MSDVLKPRWKLFPTQGWEREQAYLMFKECEFPVIVIGANLKLGNALSHWKEHGISPYLACVYVATRAANEIAAFRQRIRGDELVEHEIVHADFTVPLGKEAFTVKHVPFSFDFQRFYQDSQRDFSKSDYLAGSAPDSDHWIYMSCVPWISFTHAIQPSLSPKFDCIPKMLWGKFFEEQGEWLLPISIQAHHSLVDGLHIAQLMQKMEYYFSTPKEVFNVLSD